MVVSVNRVVTLVGVVLELGTHPAKVPLAQS